MAYEVEFTDEFQVWFEQDLNPPEQKSVGRVVDMLEQAGPTLLFPYSSGITGSAFAHEGVAHST
jgi:hypothetical protein